MDLIRVISKTEQAFGLQPAARAGLHIPLDEDAAVDPLEKFLFGSGSKKSKDTGIKEINEINESQDPNPDKAR